MKAFVVFGSSSDKHVYEPIVRNLDAEMRVCSAHRTPDLLERLLSELTYDVIIAGAGLAAHLPGVCASQSIKPVIGVPVAGNFQGLDALLAIIQMPPGIPVLATGIDNGEAAVAFVNNLEEKQGVRLVNNAGAAGEKPLEKCTKQLEDLNVPLLENGLEIIFQEYGTPAKKDGPIFVPCGTPEATDATQLMAMTQQGVWVGMNRGENAAIAAAQCLGFKDAVREHRRKQQHKIFLANKKERATYADAGVDIAKGDAAVAKMKAYVKDTFTENVLSDVGSFGGLFTLNGYTTPVLVASSDGVGTKVRVAKLMNTYDTIGQDLVNHCINDILVQGATPLFFLDYVAGSSLDPAIIAEIVKGIAHSCKENNIALLGGETAEMPGVYKPGEHDVVSAIVGCVEKEDIVTGSEITVGDILIGLPSTGLHTNGYSLAQKVLLEDGGLSVQDPLGSTTVGDALLAIHKSYLLPAQALLNAKIVKGMAHITGGGLPGNIPRILPKNTEMKLTLDWSIPDIFKKIQEVGNIEEEEMYKTFNMGVGFVVVVAPENKEQALGLLKEEHPMIIGEVTHDT